MSKTLPRPGGGTSKTQDGEICAVCKSSRYLNPNMRFLVNPTCYHKMCESCVDRIFSHGPAPCPIAGCRATLRKVRFRKQTFEDLKIEREVDIRREVAEVFTKQQSDFDTLRDYNDYLEKIEVATWNLILDVDVEETRRSMKAYAAAQNPDSKLSSASNRFSSVIAAPDPTSVVSETSHVVLKKSGAQRKGLANAGGNTPAASTEANTPTSTADAGAGGAIAFNFHGLKKKKTPEPELPFDPYEGWAIRPHYYTLAPSYSVDWLTASKDEINHIAGGYNIHEFYSRALCDAFGGMGVFVEEEKEHPERLASGDAEIASQKAAFAAVSKDVEMDDVF